MYKAATLASLDLSVFSSFSLQVTLRNVATDRLKLFEVKILPQYKSNKSDVYLKVKFNTLVCLRLQCRAGMAAAAASPCYGRLEPV